MREKMTFVLYNADDLGITLKHHGTEGQKWGVQNGPPYPLSKGRRLGNGLLIPRSGAKASKSTIRAYKKARKQAEKNAKELEKNRKEAEMAKKALDKTIEANNKKADANKYKEYSDNAKDIAKKINEGISPVDNDIDLSKAKAEASKVSNQKSASNSQVTARFSPGLVTQNDIDSLNKKLSSGKKIDPKNLTTGEAVLYAEYQKNLKSSGLIKEKQSKTNKYVGIAKTAGDIAQIAKVNEDRKTDVEYNNENVKRQKKEYKKAKKELSKLTDEELAARIRRMNLENQYLSEVNSNIKNTTTGKEYTRNKLEKQASMVQMMSATAGLFSSINDLIS